MFRRVAVGSWMSAAALVVLLCATMAAGESCHLLARGDDDPFRRAAFIAHVRIAGSLPTVEERVDDRLWLAEVIDAAHGSQNGQLVLVAERPENGGKGQRFERGESLILFASRDEQGVYRPLAGVAGRWPIDAEGKLEAHPLRDLLPPVADARKPADAIAWLWNEARQHDFSIAVALHERDLADYEHGRPLRLSITIDNTGGRPLSINNQIEFEYRYGGDLRAEEKLSESSRDVVKVYAQPLAREHVLAELQKMMHDVNELTLSPGQRCAADFDLGEESMIYGGMRYQVWAEVAGRRSPPIVFTLPGEERAVEIMEKLAELEAGGGPFKIVEREGGDINPMPMVEPTDEAAAIDAALSAWLAESQRWKEEGGAADGSEQEIVLLASANLPPEFVASDQRHRIVAAEPLDVDDEGPIRFSLPGGEAVFRGRALRIEQVEVGKRTAEVLLHEVGADHRGMRAIVPLRREQGVWRLASEIMLQQN